MAKITIFGLAGAGKTTVGKLLAKELNYEFVSSGNLFRERAKSMGMTLYELEALCNKNPNFDREFDKDVEKYGRTHQNFVLESRLGWYFVPDSFKIKLTCDLNERVKRVARRDKESFEEALKKTQFREISHEERYFKTYGITNFGHDSIFDVIVDSTHVGASGTVSKMKQAFEKR